jgi:hypothetical protein
LPSGALAVAGFTDRGGGPVLIGPAANAPAIGSAATEPD